MMNTYTLPCPVGRRNEKASELSPLAKYYLEYILRYGKLSSWQNEQVQAHVLLDKTMRNIIITNVSLLDGTRNRENMD